MDPSPHRLEETKMTEENQVTENQAPAPTPRIRRTIDQIIEAEEAKLTKLQEAVDAQEGKIGKLKEQKLDGERRSATMAVAQELAQAAKELTPEEIAALLAEVKARRAEPQPA
jgi:hypothetical protein